MKLNRKMKRRRPDTIASGKEKKFINNDRYNSQELSNLRACSLNIKEGDQIVTQTEPIVHQDVNDLRFIILKKKQNVGNDQSNIGVPEDENNLTSQIQSENSQGEKIEVSVTIKKDNKGKRQVVINDGKTISNENVEVNEVKKCISCPEDPYLICQGTSETVIPSLKNDPPKFVKDISAFNKTHKLCSSLRIFCTNCSSGPMTEFDRVSEHFQGKSHKNKVKGNKNVLKIILCSTCYKVCCIFSPEETTNHKELPEDLSDLLKKIFPLAKLKGNLIEDQKPKKRVNLKKKSPDGVDLIFTKFDVSSSFKTVFDEAVKFGNNLSLILQGMVLLKKTSDPTLCSAFCRYNRNTTSLVQDKLKIQDNITVNGSSISIENPQNFDGTLDNLISTNVKDQNFSIIEWNVGNLAPSCEIFKDWASLNKLVESKIEEMRETSKKYHDLTSSISCDVVQSVSGPYRIRAIHFFGSRVTGLALKDSDFDLQITTGDFSSVRGLSDRCFIHSPLFVVKHIIPWAKVPVIKILHKKTQIMCDVSLNNMTGVINSQLLRFYLDLDERVKWLIVIVKMWASMNLITGSHIFTSYTLAWLVLFFLMQRHIYLVPNVQLLTQLPNVNPRNLLYSGETGMGFVLDIREVMKFHNPKTMCTMTKFNLLCEFFKFCIEVMPMKNVLDPFTGQMFTRQTLMDSNRRMNSSGNLNNEKNIKIYSLITVDPIMHSSNISASVTNRSLNNFINLSKQTLECLLKSFGR